jgi:hypothetical protein
MSSPLLRGTQGLGCRGESAALLSTAGSSTPQQTARKRNRDDDDDDRSLAYAGSRPRAEKCHVRQLTVDSSARCRNSSSSSGGGGGGNGSILRSVASGHNVDSAGFHGHGGAGVSADHGEAAEGKARRALLGGVMLGTVQLLSPGGESMDTSQVLPDVETPDAQAADTAADEHVPDFIASAEWDTDEEDSRKTITLDGSVLLSLAILFS